MGFEQFPSKPSHYHDLMQSMGPVNFNELKWEDAWPKWAVNCLTVPWSSLCCFASELGHLKSATGHSCECHVTCFNGTRHPPEARLRDLPSYFCATTKNSTCHIYCGIWTPAHFPAPTAFLVQGQHLGLWAIVLTLPRSRRVSGSVLRQIPISG